VDYVFRPPCIFGYITISGDITVSITEKLGLENMGIAFGFFSYVPPTELHIHVGIQRCKKPRAPEVKEYLSTILLSFYSSRTSVKCRKSNHTNIFRVNAFMTANRLYNA